ncbi:ATP-binding protein [Streptomyces sp. NPDC051133]|uniref:ATP-binding protein n=1 Tax=Streptomyces sp. NPDC051133 TaxID=3155521 RepID=UPI00342D81A6
MISEPLTCSEAFAGSGDIAAARDLAVDFLTHAQDAHGIPVSGQATDMVKLVVSELVTNARKHAPGPCLLILEISDNTVRVAVWDSNPTLPTIPAPDPRRVGQHGLEIVTTICQSFEAHRKPVGKSITVAIGLASNTRG